MSIEDISAFESREVKMKLCEVCVDTRGLDRAIEDQAWVCSKCNTPLVGEIIHLQRCYSPDECTYEHLHHACYGQMATEMIT
ncbi:hypothetical protein IX51_00695 [uncultured archaeon]|nr:hypothetical protein IX51_00695 [uncultured archaeon]